MTRKQQNAIAIFGVLLTVFASSAWSQNSSLFQNPLQEYVPAPAGVANSPFASPVPNQRMMQGVPNATLGMAGQGNSAMGNPATGMPGNLIPGNPVAGNPLAMASWTYQPPVANKVLKLHDIVSIRVDEGARMSAEGRASQRKNALYDGKIAEWLRFEGLDTVKPATQSDGDPAVKGQLQTTYRANSDVVTRESIVFNIAAEVADIRPNGNVVLEAHKTITINDNRWKVSLSGICQSQDIGPDNVVLSRNMIDLQVDKHETGQARDGYRRGWFVEFFSRFQPF